MEMHREDLTLKQPKKRVLPNFRSHCVTKISKILPVRFSLGNLVESPAGFFAAGIVPVSDTDTVTDKISRIRSSSMFDSVSSMHAAFKVNDAEGSFDDEPRLNIGHKLLQLITKLKMNNVAIFVARWDRFAEVSDTAASMEAALKATQHVLEWNEPVPAKSTLLNSPSQDARKCSNSSVCDRVVLSNFPNGFLSNLWSIARPHEILRRLCTALATLLQGKPVKTGWLVVADVLKKRHDLATVMLMWTPDKVTKQAWLFAKEQIQGIASDSAERAHAGGAELLRWLHIQLGKLGYMKDDLLKPYPVSAMKHAIFSADGIITIDTIQRVRPNDVTVKAKPPTFKRSLAFRDIRYLQ